MPNGFPTIIHGRSMPLLSLVLTEKWGPVCASGAMNGLRLKWPSEADLLLFLMGTLKCHLSEHWTQTVIRAGALSCKNAGNMGGAQQRITGLLEAGIMLYV